MSADDGRILLDNRELLENGPSIDTLKLELAHNASQGEFFLQQSHIDEENQSILISYIVPVNSWGWIIGVESELNESISESKAYYLKGVIRKLNSTVLILGVILLVMFF